MKHKFVDDEPLECTNCGLIIDPGTDYCKWKVKFFEYVFCDRDCACEFIVNYHKGEITDEHLDSAEDKALRYADIKCHEMME